MNENENIISLKNDINILLERLGKLENSQENKNEIDAIRLELQQLNNRAIQLEQNMNNNANSGINNNANINSGVNNGSMFYKNNMPPNYGYNAVNNYGYKATNSYVPVNKLPPNVNNNQDRHTDFEKNLGTNVMSVLAAILIFIGIASLTALVYKNFSNVMKSVLMISITLTISSLGVFFLSKKRSIFNYSITAIGVGGVYISLIASGIMSVLNLAILTLLIISWTCIVHWQNLKYNSFVLYLIELIGFEMSIVMGLISLKSNFIDYIIGLTLILGNVIYLILLENSHKLKPSLNTILDMIIEVSRFRLIFLLLYNVEEFKAVDIGLFYYIIIIAIILVSMLFSLNRAIKKYAISNRDSLITHIIFSHIILVFGIFSILVKVDIVSEAFLINMSGSDILFLVTLLYCYFINISGLRKINARFSRNLTYAILIIGYIFSLFNSFIHAVDLYILNNYDYEYMSSYLYDIFIAILVLKLGMLLMKYTNDTFYRKITLIFATVHSMCVFISATYAINMDYCSILHTIIIGITLCLEMYVFKKMIPKYIESLAIHKSVFDKVLLMIITDTMVIASICLVPKLLTFGLIKNFSTEVDIYLIIMITLLVIYKVYCSKLGYFTDFNSLSEAISRSTLNKCDWSYRVFLISNALWILIFSSGGGRINNLVSLLSFMASTLGILVLTFIGSIRSLRQNGKYYGIVMGIKYSIVLGLLMHLWGETFKWFDDISSIAYSILLLLMCISFIICGWSVKIKSLRIFGLLGTMFSIAKLLFIDIHFDDSLVKTLAYIISGVMCAIIVWLYDRMNKEDRSENH